MLNPLLYLSAMGLGLGTLVNQHGTAKLGGVSYLAFLAPGLLAATAMQTAIGESTYPVMAQSSGGAPTRRPRRRRCGPPTCSTGTCCSPRSGCCMNCGAFLAVMAVFGAAQSPLGAGGAAGGGPDRAGVRGAGRGVGDQA